MTKRSTFVGLDVHKEFIGVAIADSGRFGEVPTYGTVGATSMCSKTPPSSSLIPKRAGGRVKTDRRDAVTLARWHRAGELRPIYVPNESDEALRDLVRAREDAVEVAREAKQRLKAVNLRHGLRYRGRAGWTIPYRRWPADLTMSVPAPQFALQEYLAPVEEAEACVARLAEQLRQLVPLWRWAPVVEALRLTKHSHINVRIQRRRPEYGDAGVRWNPWLLRPISTGRLAQFVIRLHYRCSRHPAARLAVRGIRVLPSVYGRRPVAPRTCRRPRAAPSRRGSRSTFRRVAR